MSRNRIRQYFVDTESSASPQASGFAILPAFAAQISPSRTQPSVSSAATDIYRMAYEQAQTQVAQRRERKQRAGGWN